MFCTIIKLCANFFYRNFYFLWQYDTCKLLFQNEQRSLNFKWHLYSQTLSSIKKNHIELNCNLNFQTMTTTFQRNSWIKHFHKISHTWCILLYQNILVLSNGWFYLVSCNKTHVLVMVTFVGRQLQQTSWWDHLRFRMERLTLSLPSSLSLWEDNPTMCPTFSQTAGI